MNLEKLRIFLASLSLEQIDAEIAKRERQKDILVWGKYYFPDKFSLDFCDKLHGYFIEIRRESFTSTLAPRSHAKTAIKCFLIPIFQALVEPESFKHYLNVQNTVSKAININLTIREELEHNEKLIRDYGDQVDNKKWTEKQFVLKNNIIFTAIGSGESVRGLNYQNIRPDYLILDDIYDDEDINNIHRIEKIERWFWGSIYPARAQDLHTSIHIQGTAINKHDLMHKLQEVTGVKYKKFQAIIDENKKETLWFSYEDLMRDRELMGSIIFSREMQNECRDESTAIIKESWLKYYDGQIPGDEKITNVIGACDPAVGEKQQNDFTGKVLVYKTENHNYYIHEIKNDKLTFHQNKQDIQSWHNRIGFNTFKLEAIAAFKGLAQEIRRTTNVPLSEIQSVKDKISRKEEQSSKFENGKVLINSQIPKQLLNQLVYQLINNHPNHDDISDAVILALEDTERPLQFTIR